MDPKRAEFIGLFQESTQKSPKAPKWHKIAQSGHNNDNDIYNSNIVIESNMMQSFNFIVICTHMYFLLVHSRPES